MSEPVRKAWSSEELQNAAREFMRVNYLPERGNKKAERLFLERLGLLATFADWIWDVHPSADQAEGKQS